MRLTGKAHCMSFSNYPFGKLTLQRLAFDVDISRAYLLSVKQARRLALLRSEDTRRVESTVAGSTCSWMCESWLTRTLAPQCVSGKVDEKATQLHAIASLKVLLDATKPQNGAATSSAANHVTVAQRLEHEKNQETQLAGMQEQPNGVASGLEDATAVDTVSILKSLITELNVATIKVPTLVLTHIEKRVSGH